MKNKLEQNLRSDSEPIHECRILLKRFVFFLFSIKRFIIFDMYATHLLLLLYDDQLFAKIDDKETVVVRRQNFTI